MSTHTLEWYPRRLAPVERAQSKQPIERVGNFTKCTGEYKWYTSLLSPSDVMMVRCPACKHFYLYDQNFRSPRATCFVCHR